MGPTFYEMGTLGSQIGTLNSKQLCNHLKITLYDQLTSIFIFVKDLPQD